MKANRDQLTFKIVDELAYAYASNRPVDSILPSKFVQEKLGPLFELIHLSRSGRLPEVSNLVELTTAQSMVSALKRGCPHWYCPGKEFGYIRSVSCMSSDTSAFTSFLMSAKKSAIEVSGLPNPVAGQLVAAMEEFENNVREHSDAPLTGILAYKAHPGTFEFVTVDNGIGVLGSLAKCEDFSHLKDEGKALEAALTDGVSRFGAESNHGHGFRPLFTGLANLRSELRFRSGDHALVINGSNPDLTLARLSQKAKIDGLSISVCCFV